jgi:hypothetical protein
MTRIRLRTMILLIAMVAALIAFIGKPHFWDSPRWSRMATDHERISDAYLSRAEREQDVARAARLLEEYRIHRTLCARFARAAAMPDMMRPSIVQHVCARQ